MADDYKYQFDEIKRQLTELKRSLDEIKDVLRRINDRAEQERYTTVTKSDIEALARKIEA